MHKGRYSIRTKVLLSTMFMTIIPMIIIGVVFGSAYQKKTEDMVLSLTDSHVSQLAGNYENKMNSQERLAESLVDFKSIELYLTGDFSSKSEALSFYTANVHTLLANYNRTYKDIRVRVFHRQPDISNFSWELNDGLDNFLKINLSDGLENVEGGRWMPSHQIFGGIPTVMTYYLPVRRQKAPYDVLYLVTISVTEDFFKDEICLSASGDGIAIVTDRDGNLLTLSGTENRDGIAEMLETGELQTVQEKKDAQNMIKIDGRNYVPVCNETDDLRICYLLSFDEIRKAETDSRRTLFLVWIILLLADFFIVFLVSGEITGGLNRLKDKMEKVDLETLMSAESDLPETDSADEVVQLDHVFTQMLRRIQNLMDTVKEKEQIINDEIISRQQAEIRALQRQINPHYLFNTLESIRMNLVIKGDRENANIIRVLAENFRRYVDSRDEDTTIREELSFISKSIEIQNFRLNNKISMITELDDDIASFKIKKLLLQPLVENAINHGLEPKDGPGTVLVRIKWMDGGIIIEVSDDGVGMSPDEIRNLETAMNTKASRTSVGIQNVFERIRLIYGEDAVMRVTSEEGKGTTVTIILPAGEEMRNA